MALSRENLDYSGPIEVAEGIYWIGFADDNSGLHCNPYLIVEGEEAILIDGGSRDDFSTVMMKILQTGIDPNTISRLIYQHYDPDLCGSIPHFENLIEHEDLKIISHRENNIFIKYYSSKKPKLCIETMDYSYTFKSGRKLTFIRTPYAHSTGSFMTYDEKTGTLFSSDIFGSYDRIWDLFLKLKPECKNCHFDNKCYLDDKPCGIKGIINFHQRVMTSFRAMQYALEQIEGIDPIIVAPQHGSIVEGREQIHTVMEHLKATNNIGIDYFLAGDSDV